MTPRRRQLLRYLVFVLLTVLGCLWALPGAANARRAGPPVVDLQLSELEPVTLTLERTLRLGGQVQVLSGAEVRDASLRLEVATSPVIARSALDEVVADPGYTVPVTDAVQALGRLRPGEPIGYRLRVPADTLPLQVTGVYPIRLVVTGVVGGVSTEVASLTTLLPWYPAGDQVAKTRLLWLWPVIDGPHRDSEGQFTSDTLAGSMTPGGRLSTLVDAAAGRPVTWVIDPAVLADASAMADGYQIRVGGVSRRGLRGDDARRWLQELSAASSRREVSVVPYGDVDVTSVLDADRAALVRGGARWGGALAASVLGRPVRRDLAWPVDGQADAVAVDRMPRAAQRAVVLSGDAVPPVTTPAYTPSGRALVGTRQVDALLTDPTLDELVADPVDEQPILARQRFLAQTLLITVELPAQPRLVVVAPPRRWAPDPAYANDLLDSTVRAGWIRPVTLDRALQWEVPDLEREPVSETPPDDQLPDTYVDQASRGRVDTITFGAILTEPVPVIPAFQSAFYSSVSTAWRVNLDGGQSLLDTASSRLLEQREKVRIVSRGGTITSNTGSLPITVANDLDQAVVAGLDVQSTDGLRLQVSAPDRVRVPAGGRVSVNADVQASTSGNLTATAQLTTPRGAPYSAPVTVDVRVRAYGQVALIVFGGAAALLILAALVRVTRRIIASRAGGSPT